MAVNQEVLFSSKNQAWATRPELFDAIKEYMQADYNIDPCAEDHTAKSANYFTKETDMFSVADWGEHFGLGEIRAFMNPEYGKEQAKFIRCLMGQIVKGGGYGDVLIPSRTDTGIYHEILMPYAERIVFIKGRCVFGLDSYWEWVWQQPTMKEINGKDRPNTLYQKYGKFNAAPFGSIVARFTDASLGRIGKPKFAVMNLPRFVYAGQLGKG